MQVWSEGDEERAAGEEPPGKEPLKRNRGEVGEGGGPAEKKAGGGGGQAGKAGEEGGQAGKAGGGGGRGQWKRVEPGTAILHGGPLRCPA